MNRRQCSNQWNFGIANYPSPNNSECKRPFKNLSNRIFGMKTASSSLIIFQRAKWTVHSITYLWWWQDILGEKCGENYFKVVLVLHDNTPAHRALATKGKWSTWASKVLITHPILPIWPRRNTTCSLDWKKIVSSLFFVQIGGYCCRADLVWRTRFWNFLFDLQEMEQWAMKCIELRGEYGT